MHLRFARKCPNKILQNYCYYHYHYHHYEPGCLSRYSNGYELEGPGSIPDSVRYSVLHRVQTDSGTYSASYQMGTGSSFPEGKTTGA
jgi:hypothetical protein